MFRLKETQFICYYMYIYDIGTSVIKKKCKLTYCQLHFQTISLLLIILCDQFEYTTEL